jgi:subtilase family serine protease
MRSPSSKQLPAITLLATIFFTLSLAQPAAAQQQAAVAASHSLITQPIDESQLTVLKGNTHPLARPEFNLGTAPAALPMKRMLLVLKRSPEQESALRQLLDNQQDKSSPSYHKWLTPAQFGKQFGPTDADMQTITTWLQSHGFEVGSSKGRTTLEFSGSASQVHEAFHTTIHKYAVYGEQHWANSTDPQIPTALSPAVAGIASLNNFPKKAMNRFVGRFTRDKATGKVHPAAPLFTYQPGYECSAADYCFALGPYDFATIYNVLPLWNADINGTGQTIAIVGESNINPQDVANFRAMFDLPPNSTTTGNPLNIILNGPDPGPQGDESEADIDVQWSGAVAPYATIDFVVSQSTETTSGVDLSAVYIVDNNLAPVMSESYGECELGLGTAGNQFYSTLWQQAAAQGITVFIAAGDNGAAGCDEFGVKSPAPAQFGLEVSGYASTPYNVAVGGTDFAEFTNPERYWAVANNPTTQASALGYIPETTWNDSCTNANLSVFGFSNNAETNCNNAKLIPYYVVPGGGSGGASNCTAPTARTPASCTGGYPKPSWQTGTGVPNDGKRDLPDVSLFASNGFAGSFYLICQSDQTEGACSLNQQFLGFGGTSVSSPAFAGIMALVNQQTGSRQGNANYVFYKLAAKDTLSSCNASSSPAGTCIFNDVTSGTIAMPCTEGSPNCTTSSGDTYGVLNGYNAGTGYDQATGLGSVNANNLVTQWSSVTTLPSTTALNSLTPTTITHGQPVNFSVTVTPQSGSGTPTGEILLVGGASGKSPASIGFNLSSGAVSGTTDLLPGGTYSVTAHYPGDGNYAASDSNPISVTVSKENSQSQLFLETFNSSGTIVNPNTNTAVYGSPYLLRVNVENSSGALCTPVSPTSATSCPTGAVTLTDNGNPLDAGSYTLNSYGYFEDFSVQLPGGTNSITATYPGDNSFNAGSVTQGITISPAATTFSLSGPGQVQIGVPFSVGGTISTQSSGAGPTGSVTFFADGTMIAGNAILTPVAATATTAAYTQVTSPSLSFTTGGTHGVSAQYSGDANYSGQSAAAISLHVYYPPPSMSINASAQTVNSGANVTLTALVDNSQVGPALTGTVAFVDLITGIAVPGAITLTPGMDTNGYPDLQASMTYAPGANQVVQATYSGDPIYDAVSSGAVSLTVTGSDFSFTSSTNALTLKPGQSATVNLYIESQSNYSGTVNFAPSSCSGLPTETTCSFNSASVTGNGEVILSISTTAADSVMARVAKSGGLSLLAATGPLILGGVVLCVGPLFRRSVFSRSKVSRLLTLGVLALATMLTACGGGGGGSSSGSAGSGGGNPGTPAGGYTVTVTAHSGSLTHTVTLTLTVQ